jgi:8-hydroxy-5-deazaflavin:NADPH oxidoreductase
MKIGIIGSGEVSRALAKGFVSEGHEVTIGTRDTTQPKLVEFVTANPQVRLDNTLNTASQAEVVVLATKGDIAEIVVRELGDSINGKTVIDVTNPISHNSNGVPIFTNGVLSYFTDINESLMERLQKIAPEANFVKAFNSIGNNSMYKPQFDIAPTMFICGDNVEAKAQVKSILNQFGWESEDMGMVQSARPIESLCILWCAPGFLNNSWSHAFKLVKK